MMGLLRDFFLVASVGVVMLALHGCNSEEPAPTPAPTLAPTRGASDGDRPSDGCTCCNEISTGLLCKTNHCGGDDQKWCYVKDDVCADQVRARSITGLHWSYLACDHKQDPTYIAIETGNCRGQGYEPILTEDCTHAYVVAANGFHHNFQVRREEDPNKPEGCYYIDEEWHQAEAGVTIDLYQNIHPEAAGLGAFQNQQSFYKQLCKSSHLRQPIVDRNIDSVAQNSSNMSNMSNMSLSAR